MDELFQPGDAVSTAGVYQLLHYRHRLPHEAIILQGQSFPACSECGNNLRFRLVRAALPIEDDRNFRVAKSHKAG